MAEKHVILILAYDGETNESRAKIVTEAKAIETKLQERGYDVTLHQTQRAFEEWMTKGTAGKKLNKIHIVAHGNYEQCGNYNAAGLADYICAYIKGQTNLKAITIHSCMSASVYQPTQAIFIQQFASRLLELLGGGNFSKYIVVRGSDGESYTDSTGRNWVLKDGVKPVYRTREGEEEFLKNSTKDRNTARPKYAISNYPDYRGVDSA
jgi:hypothetical protein